MNFLCKYTILIAFIFLGLLSKGQQDSTKKKLINIQLKNDSNVLFQNKKLNKMKKLFALFALLAIIVLSTATLFAQSDTTGTGGGGGSSDPLELIFLSVHFIQKIIQLHT